MNPVQEIADTIKEFEHQKALILTSFEKTMQKKSPEVRDKMASYFNSYAEEMVEHGFFSHYHDGMSYTIQHLLPLYPHTGAILIAYYFSDPKERLAFRKNIIEGCVMNQRAIANQNPELKKYDICELGRKLLEYQYSLIRPYYGYRRQPEVALNMMITLSKQPTPEKEKIEQLVKDSFAITKVSGLEAGVPYLANRLLPYFYKECSQKSAELNRHEKIKRTKSILHSFAWLLLNQNEYSAYSDVKRGLYPYSRAELNRFLNYCH